MLVTQHARLKAGETSWRLQGQQLHIKEQQDGRAASPKKSSRLAFKETNYDQQFKNCEMHVIQSATNGAVRALLIQHHSRCEPWLRRQLLQAGKLVVPVIRHPDNDAEFMAVEGEDKDKVHYRVGRTPNQHIVDSRIHFEQDQLLSAPVGDTSHMAKGRSFRETHFRPHDGQQLKARGVSLVSLGEHDDSIPEESGSFGMPQGPKAAPYGKSHQPAHNPHFHKVTHHLQLLSEKRRDNALLVADSTAELEQRPRCS